jgi:hypothetical protein
LHETRFVVDGTAGWKDIMVRCNSSLLRVVARAYAL